MPFAGAKRLSRDGERAARRFLRTALNITKFMNFPELGREIAEVGVDRCHRLSVGPIIALRRRDIGDSIEIFGGQLAAMATGPVDDEVARERSEVRTVRAFAVEGVPRFLAERANEDLLHEIAEIGPTAPFLAREKAPYVRFHFVDIGKVNFLESSPFACPKSLKKVGGFGELEHPSWRWASTVL